MGENPVTEVTIARVGADDLADLLPLLRAYCDFYRVAPSDEDLVALCRALIADPDREGLQLIARDQDARAVGFATIYWTWSTTQAGRLGVMNDLFVAEGSRGAGVAEALIDACRKECAVAVYADWHGRPHPRTVAPKLCMRGSGRPASDGSTTGWQPTRLTTPPHEGEGRGSGHLWLRRG